MPNNIKAFSIDFDGVMDIIDRKMPESSEVKIGRDFEYEFIPTHHTEQECKQWLQSVYTLALFGKPENGKVELKESFGINKEPTPVNLSQQQILKDFPFLAEIKTAIEKKEGLALYCGSNRQTDKIDSDIQKAKRQALSANESLGLLVGVIKENGVTIAHNQKTDIRLQGPEGGMNENYQFADDVKLMTLLKQMHTLARDNPNDRLTYTFMDDREDIINRLEDILKNNPKLIPKNMEVSLTLSESLTQTERGGQMPVHDKKEVIQGTGETLSADRINDASKALSKLMQDKADRKYNIFPYKPIPIEDDRFTEAQKIERNELIERQEVAYLKTIKAYTIDYSPEAIIKLGEDIKKDDLKIQLNNIVDNIKTKLENRTTVHTTFAQFFMGKKVTGKWEGRKKRIETLMKYDPTLLKYDKSRKDNTETANLTTKEMEADLAKLTELAKDRKGILGRKIKRSTESISKDLDKYREGKKSRKL